MTEPGRVALLVVVAWLLAAVALLVVQGMLLPWLLAAGAGSAALLVLRALVRQLSQKPEWAAWLASGNLVRTTGSRSPTR